MTGGRLGQPRGLGWLVLAEGWASFATYGVRVLLVLYMAESALVPGRAGRVWGLAWIVGGGGEARSPAALAAGLLGLYASLGYLTPLAGALVADRLLGRTRTILAGAALTIAGTLLLAYPPALLAALALLLLGAGCFGGNLTARLGELYATDDPRRGDGFQLYYLAVDAGVIATPLVCGTLGEVLGYGYGFAAAALGMVASLAAYLAALPHLPADPPLAHGRAARRPPIGRRGWRAVAVLMLLIPLLGLAAVANNQIYGAYELWARTHYDLTFGGRRMPVSWLLSADAAISFGCGFAVLAAWRWLEARRRLPDEATRCAAGALISAAGAALLAAAAARAGTGRVGLGWALAFHLVNDVGVAMLFPLTLALYSRAAPPGVAATMINASKLNFALSYAVVGRLGALVDRVHGARFWAIHAGIVAAAGLALLVAARAFRPLLAPTAAPA